MSNVVETVASLQSERRKYDLSRAIGSFASSRLASAGLLDIAEQVFRGAVLDRKALCRLCTDASLPLLAKLVEIRTAPLESAREPRMRPVVLIAIADLLEQRGALAANDYVQGRLEQVDAEILYDRPIYVAIDRWLGKFSLDELLGIVGEIVTLPSLRNRYRLLGPSSTELRTMIEQSGDTSESLPNTLGVLRKWGVQSVEGGSELDVLECAAASGFSVIVGQRVPHDRELSGGIGFEESFVEQLVVLRDRLGPSGNFDVWFPWVPEQLDRKSVAETTPLGAQLLRAVAVGYLGLSCVKRIRAPLSLLGEKMAHVALSFGANDVGFAAVDTTTSQALGILKISDTEHVVRPRSRFEKVLD